MDDQVIIPIYAIVTFITIGIGQLGALFTLIWRGGRYSATIEGKLNVLTVQVRMLSDRLKTLEQRK